MVTEFELLIIVARHILSLRDNLTDEDDRYALAQAAHYLEQYAALLDQTPSLPSRRAAASAFK